MRTIVLAAFAFTTLAAAAAPSKSAIVSAGLCEQPKVTERYSQPQSTSGYATIGKLYITKQTDVVPLRQGIAFGFTWRAEGLPRIAKVVYLIEHPLITRPDGKQLRSFEEPMEHETERGVLQTTDCYALGEPHELVPGDWSLTILHNGTPLVKRTFQVVREK
jgi:hypothetical protein